MRGGSRPGTGRPKGAKDKKPRKRPELNEKEKIKQILAIGERAKARMYQEYLVRISQGEKLSLAEKRLMDKIGGELSAGLAEKAPPLEQTAGDMEAHEYLRRVWNDPNIEPALRIRAAEIVFKGAAEKMGKKDEKNDRAKQAGAGRFAAGKPPLSVVK